MYVVGTKAHKELQPNQALEFNIDSADSKPPLLPGFALLEVRAALQLHSVLNPIADFARHRLHAIKTRMQKAIDRQQRSHILTDRNGPCLLYTSPSPRDATLSRMPSSA